MTRGSRNTMDTRRTIVLRGGAVTACQSAHFSVLLFAAAKEFIVRNDAKPTVIVGEGLASVEMREWKRGCS